MTVNPRIPPPSTRDFGPPPIVVRIESIQDDVASTVDRAGVVREISTTIMRAKGLQPQVTELWHIDRTVGGTWTFAAVVRKVVPAITGDRHGNTPLASLLTNLDRLGLIIDQTTDSGASAPPSTQTPIYTADTTIDLAAVAAGAPLVLVRYNGAGSRLDGGPLIPAWQPNHLYSDVDWVRPTTGPTDHLYGFIEGSGDHTSGPTEPVWPTPGDVAGNGSAGFYWRDNGLAAMTFTLDDPADGLGHHLFVTADPSSSTIPRTWFWLRTDTAGPWLVDVGAVVGLVFVPGRGWQTA